MKKSDKKKFDLSQFPEDNEPKEAVTFWIKGSLKDKYKRLQGRTREKYCQHLIELIEQDIEAVEEPSAS